MDNTIYFYDDSDKEIKPEHYFLNNFDPSPFKADDNFLYPSVEHFYQCHKFDNFSENINFKNAFEEIRQAPDPLKCKKLARKYEAEFLNIWQKENWENGYKDEIMQKGLTYKFSQNKDLLEKLLKTGNSRLVEKSFKDPYWGGMLEGSKSKLGNFLMELRDNYNEGKGIWLSKSKIDNPIII